MSDTTDSETDADEPRWQSFASTVKITVRATRCDIVSERDTSHPRYGSEMTRFETEGDLVFDTRLGNNIINVDAYIRPPGDYLYDYPTEIEGDDYVIHTGYSDVDYELNLYVDELRAGAQKRAAEDHSHEVRTLAGWLYLAGGADHVSQADSRVFYVALKTAIEDADDPPDWEIAFMGDPAESHTDRPTVDTLDEALTYAGGGYAAVSKAREADDE